MASITSIHLTKVAFGSIAANLGSLFHGRKFKAAHKANGGSGSA